jgi:predicted DNA-binding protein with PD1-like motif
MRHRPIEGGWILRLEPAEPIIQSLAEFCERQRTTAGSFTGIGAVRWARLGYYDQDAGEYLERRLEGGLEVVSLTGNVSLRSDGSFFPHTHVVLSDREMRAFAGHLFEAEVGPTLEIYLWAVEGEVRRTAVPGTALEVVDL